MYGSYQRHIVESAHEEARLKRIARLQPLHKAHADKTGIECPDVALVGASWLKQWSCTFCGWSNLNPHE